MSQGPVTAVPPESGCPPELEPVELLPELVTPELLPELALPELLPELSPPELLPELALPELAPDPPLPLDPELPPAPGSDSSCPSAASGTLSDGPPPAPHAQRVDVAANSVRSQRALIGARFMSLSPSVGAACAQCTCRCLPGSRRCLQGPRPSALAPRMRTGPPLCRLPRRCPSERRNGLLPSQRLTRGAGREASSASQTWSPPCCTPSTYDLRRIPARDRSRPRRRKGRFRRDLAEIVGETHFASAGPFRASRWFASALCACACACACRRHLRPACG